MAQIRPLGCIIASTITIVTGIILLFGAIVVAKDTNYLHDHWTQIYGLAIYSIVISILVMIGAVGLIYVVNRQFPALTTLFSGFLILVAFLAVICVTILATGRNDLQMKTYDKTEQLFQNYTNPNMTNSTKIIVDHIQQSFRCCGFSQPIDWKTQITNSSTPDSCCKKIVDGCGKGSLGTLEKIYSIGCVGELYISFHQKYSSLIGMNIAVALFALLSAIFGIIYERNIRQQYQSM